MASRVTQVSRRTLAQPGSAARVTQVARRVLAQPDGAARVTQLSRRVLVTNWAVPGQTSDVTIIE